MSKTTMMAVPAFAVASFFTGSAVAQNVDISLGDLIFDPHDTTEPSTVFNFDEPLTNTENVIGFSISFDFVNVANDSSWASDLELKITAPGGEQWIVGQERFNGGDPFGNQDDIWDFDGQTSQPTGSYSSDHFPSTWGPDGIGRQGDWNFMLAETWDGGTEYNNVVLTLIKAPAPGALALVLVAGLAPSRRRRRA